MGLFDEVIKMASSIVPGSEEILEQAPDLLDTAGEYIEQESPAFDPTCESAEYGEEVQFAGDFVANVVTEGGAGTIFSDACDGIATLNEATDNAFTAESIGDALGDLF